MEKKANRAKQTDAPSDFEMHMQSIDDDEMTV